MRPILILAALALLAPVALAHFPPGPVFTCQPRGTDRYHDYHSPATGSSVSPGDGNLEDCPKPNPIQAGAGLCFPATGGIPFVCDPVSTGVERPLIDYDGELDHGIGGVVLFYDTGDGATSGVTACYSWPAVGHHAGGISAQDALWGPVPFTVTSDYSRPGLEETPDCGDLIVEPCNPNPPQPSILPFPVNVVVDTVNGALYTVFGPGGEGCNDLDNVLSCPVATWPPVPGGGVNSCNPPFGPGADGSLKVLVGRPGFPATAGHVWTF